MCLQVANMHAKACICLAVALILLVLEISKLDTKLVSAKDRGKLLGIVCRSSSAGLA